MRNKCQHCCGSMQTDVTCWAQQCCLLLANNVVSVCMGLKRTQHCSSKNPNNTQQCCDLLRPFAWAFKELTSFSKLLSSQVISVLLQINGRSSSCVIFDKKKLVENVFSVNILNCILFVHFTFQQIELYRIA